MFTNKLLNDSIAEAVKKVMKDEESGLRMAAHAAHKSGKKMFTFQGKTYPVKVQGEEVSFGEAIEEAKDCVTEPKAKEIAKKEVKSHETQHHGEKGDVAKHVKKMHKEETFKDRLIESAYGKKSPMIDEDDSEMTPEQKKKKEKIVLSMKDKEKEFKAKYGKNWKSVMYATATKLAMKEDFDPEELEEAKDEVEQIDELDKSTMRSYVNKAAVDIARSGVTKGMLTHQSNKEIMSKRIDKRLKGIDTATKRLAYGRLAYEETEGTNMISFNECVAEATKWRKRSDAYDVDDEGNKIPRNPNSPKYGYDPLQRRADTAGDAKTSSGKKAALKSSLKMAKGIHGPKGVLPEQVAVEETEQVDEVSKVEVDKFHKKLDTLVHSSFGKSSKEKKMKEDVEQIDEVGDTEKGRQALTKLIGARVQDPKGKHGLEGAKRALKRLGPARRLRGEEVEQIDEKNKSHTHAAHYENDKGEWVGMNLLVAKDDNDAISQAHEKCKEGCRLSRVERHIPVKESTDDDVPFVPDKKKSSANVTDKSGAHHTAMSRVRHLAKQAIEKQKKMKKEMIGKAGMTSEETNEE